MDVALELVNFAIIGLAAKEIGHFLGHYRLPHITGYLLAGVVVGPFVLELIEQETIYHLHLLEEVSLSVIAFLAGSELYLQELKGRHRSIATNVATQMVSIFTIATLAVYLLADFIPFTKSMTAREQLGVAILAGTVLVSRSPAAAVAVIKEVRAKGSFTKIVLGITLSMDVTLIILFTVVTILAGILVNGETFSLDFVGILAVNLMADMLIGLLAWRLLAINLGSRLPSFIKAVYILLIGYGIFV
jgi:Kef-type K+ transport system membrane component KefB